MGGFKRASALVLVVLVGACTFPTVDYLEVGPPCSVTGKCASDAVSCGDDARKVRTTCEQQCKPMDSSCPSRCASDYQIDINQCQALCESCGQSQGCSNPVASCQALTGS